MSYFGFKYQRATPVSKNNSVISRRNLTFLASKLCSVVIFITPQPNQSLLHTLKHDILVYCPLPLYAAVLPKVNLFYRSCNRSFSVLLHHAVRLFFLIHIGCYVIATVQILLFFFFET